MSPTGFHHIPFHGSSKDGTVPSHRYGVTTPVLVRVDAVEIIAFFQRYKLGDDICQLFVAKALDPLDCLFEFNDDELKNGNHYFTDTYIAALRLAVKKALSETDSTVRVITPKQENETSANGEKGDRGGHGGHQGAGGASGAVEVQGFDGTEGISGEVFVGGQGEGGEHGNLAEAPQTPALYVALFTRIQIGRRYLGVSGGRGGQGGMGTGGRGKDGESQEIACLLFSYHEEPRRPRSFTILTPSDVPPNLRQLLMDEEFQFVGGLFEAYDPDMLSQSFESRESSVVTAALKKFVTRREILFVAAKLKPSSYFDLSKLFELGQFLGSKTNKVQIKEHCLL
ncbi:hypothetical protein C8J57DRAFT_1222497 [Mycena rebaudengoi]|nr:hypothetical protein C8J57DRAFT_1230344 [Mycena rebaudengoi]KAJ7277699.1 hypothetical protein C8J57DRAFT_1222497 [Mycena rebaudengoi]